MLKLTSDLVFVPCRRCGRPVLEGQDYCDACEGPLFRALRRMLETAGGDSPKDKKARARIIWWVIWVLIAISVPVLMTWSYIGYLVVVGLPLVVAAAWIFKRVGRRTGRR